MRNSVSTKSSNGTYNFEYSDDISYVQSYSTTSITHNIVINLVTMINSPNHKSDKKTISNTLYQAHSTIINDTIIHP